MKWTIYKWKFTSKYPWYFSTSVFILGGLILTSFELTNGFWAGFGWAGLWLMFAYRIDYEGSISK